MNAKTLSRSSISRWSFSPETSSSPSPRERPTSSIPCSSAFVRTPGAASGASEPIISPGPCSTPSSTTTSSCLQDDPREVEVGEIYALKRDINHLYRTTRPIREIAAGFLRENDTLLTDRARPFFIDLNDHAIQVVETTEFLREGSNALRELYLSLASHRMNEVMKVLTCFSTIFLPLTFIAGIYGMNFEDMPELKHPWGYPVVWIVFFLCAAGMFWLFRRMRWL